RAPRFALQVHAEREVARGGRGAQADVGSEHLPSGREACPENLVDAEAGLGLGAGPTADVHDGSTDRELVVALAGDDEALAHAHRDRAPIRVDTDANTLGAGDVEP